MLLAERGGKTPAQRILIAGRKKCPWLVDWKQQPRGKADLGHLVDKNPVVGKLGAYGVEEGDLRLKLFHPLAPSGLAFAHLRRARGALDIVRRQFGQESFQNRLCR